MQNFISIRRRGWFRRIPSSPLLGFCLCLSFLGHFVTRTGRAGGPIFTTYTSYNVFLPNDVPFGGLVDNAPHLGGHIPKTPILGGVNRRFQAKPAKSKNMHNYQNYCIDSNRILHSDKGHQMPFAGGPNTHITNPPSDLAPSWKNRKIVTSR